MNKFDELYHKLIEESIIVEDINEVYDSSKFLIYEKNIFLPVPNSLIKTVKDKVLNSINNKDFNKEFNINLSVALNDSFMKDFNEDGLYNDLKQLFKDKHDAYFNLIVDNNDYYVSFEYGSFNYPKEFKYDYSFKESHFNGPKLQPLKITENKDIKPFIAAYKKELNIIKPKYEHMKELFKLFRKHILNFNDFRYDQN